MPIARPELTLNDVATRMLVFAAFVVLAGVFSGPSRAWAGYDEGVAAYKRGDYSAALQEFRQLVANDDDTAELFLGGMYLFGRGVRQDDAEAIKWYKLAARHDNPKAEFRLGRMYFAGRGVPEDIVMAHAWFILAASHDHVRSIKWRDFTAKRMRPAEIVKAQELAQTWTRKFQARKKQ